MDLAGLFKNASNTEVFPAGATIFEEGAEGHLMYVILEGEVEVRTPSGYVDVLGPGEVLGEMALIDSQPRSATAVAKTDARLAPVDEKRFLYMVGQTPFFSLQLMRVLAERLRRMNETRQS